MPRYRIDQLSFINNRLVQPGGYVESDARPGEHWVEVDDNDKEVKRKANKQKSQSTDDESLV